MAQMSFAETALTSTSFSFSSPAAGPFSVRQTPSQPAAADAEAGTHIRTSPTRAQASSSRKGRLSMLTNGNAMECVGDGQSVIGLNRPKVLLHTMVQSVDARAG